MHPITVLARGKFRPQDVVVSINPSNRKIDPRVEAQLDALWEKKLAKALAAGKHIYNGISYRLNSLQEKYGGKVKYLFFDPAPNEVLEARMKDRTEADRATRMAKLAWFKTEADKTGLPFVHITNERSIAELLQQVESVVIKA